MTNQLGGWSVSWQGVFGAGHVCCMGPPDQIPPGTTVQEGVRNNDPNAVYVRGRRHRREHARGRLRRRGRREGVRRRARRQPGAAAAAGSEGADQDGSRATGKPVIVVVIAGRPVGLGPDAENANAILMAYQGSTEAGQAAADVIFGKVNPSGKLAISWPSDAARAGRGLRRQRAVAAGRPAEVLRPATGHRVRAGARLQPALPVRFRPLVHHVHHDEPVGHAGTCRGRAQ